MIELAVIDRLVSCFVASNQRSHHFIPGLGLVVIGIALSWASDLDYNAQLILKIFYTQLGSPPEN